MSSSGTHIRRSLASALLGTTGLVFLTGAGIYRGAEPWHLSNPLRNTLAGAVDMNVAPLAGKPRGTGCHVATLEFTDPKHPHHPAVVGAMVNNPHTGIAPAARVTSIDVYESEAENLNIYPVLNYSIASVAPYDGSRNAIYHAERYGVSGRDGKGTLIFTAAGNFDFPYYESDKMRADVMAIGAIDQYGVVPPFSAKGPYVFAVAPGVRMAPGSGAHYDGTSFSAPLASGLGCLLLETNPALSRIDVQDIIALSSRPHKITGAPFTINSAKTLNGGGYAFRNGAGFGVLDAFAAVRLAETWQATNPHGFRVNSANITGTSSANPQTQATIIPAEPVIADTVSVYFSALSFSLGNTIKSETDVSLILESPSGTKVTLFTPVPQTLLKDPRRSISHWASTPYFRGEPVKGEWKLTLKSPVRADVTLAGWTLNINGRYNPGRQIFVFNDAFKTAAGTVFPLAPSPDALHTINTAPITKDVSIYLDGSQPSRIGNGTVAIPPATIDTVHTGDGNDTIITGYNHARIMGGRGDDTVFASGPAQTYIYRAGIDGNDSIIQNAATRGTLIVRGLGETERINIRYNDRKGIVITFGRRAGSVVFTGGVTNPPRIIREDMTSPPLPAGQTQALVPASR